MSEKKLPPVLFDTIQEMVFEEYKKNGYLEIYDNAIKVLLPLKLDNLIDIAELGLIGTEISECIEKIRDNKPIGNELADIVIRVMNFSSRKAINLRNAIIRKHYINMKREKLHGRKVI